MNKSSKGNTVEEVKKKINNVFNKSSCLTEVLNNMNPNSDDELDLVKTLSENLTKAVEDLKSISLPFQPVSK